MAALDQLIPDPHLVELDRLRVSAPAEAVWETARHSALAQAWPIRALFALRSAMMRDSAGSSPTIRIDDLRSSADRPGFQILIDDPPRELAVGAIGKVWRLKIPFVHVAGAHDYALFRATWLCQGCVGTAGDTARHAWRLRRRGRGSGARDGQAVLAEISLLLLGDRAVLAFHSPVAAQGNCPGAHTSSQAATSGGGRGPAVSFIINQQQIGHQQRIGLAPYFTAAAYGFPPRAFEISAMARWARMLLPASSSGGDTTAMPNLPGDTAMIPPPTPLLAGRPV